MPAKRQKSRLDFNILSIDDTTHTDEAREGLSNDFSIVSVMSVSDAPKNSKFYADAEMYVPTLLQ
jgi:hypothetical protein